MAIISEELRNEIIRLSELGVLSRLEIATRLGMTKNQVCGILWRAGHPSTRRVTRRALKGPADDKARRRKTMWNKAIEERREVKVALGRTPSFDLPSWPWRKDAGPVGIMDLGALHCRWPVDHAEARPGGWYCGKMRSLGSYCREHAAIAYTKNVGGQTAWWVPGPRKG